MRNKPLPGMMKHSPMKQKTHPKHPVTPPTKEESKKSKGTLKAGAYKTPGFNPKEDWKNTKRIWGTKLKRPLIKNPFTQFKK